MKGFAYEKYENGDMEEKEEQGNTIIVEGLFEVQQGHTGFWIIISGILS